MRKEKTGSVEARTRYNLRPKLISPSVIGQCACTLALGVRRIAARRTAGRTPQPPEVARMALACGCVTQSLAECRASRTGDAHRCPAEAGWSLFSCVTPPPQAATQRPPALMSEACARTQLVRPGGIFCWESLRPRTPHHASAPSFGRMRRAARAGDVVRWWTATQEAGFGVFVANIGDEQGPRFCPFRKPSVRTWHSSWCVTSPYVTKSCLFLAYICQCRSTSKA